jgi:hypothetical protein
MEGQSDMHEYFSDFGLRLRRLTQAHGIEIEGPAIESRLAAEILALAGTVAHTSERKFAPIASFAAGIAVGRLQGAGLLSIDQDAADFIAELRKELDRGGRDHDPNKIDEIPTG